MQLVEEKWETLGENTLVASMDKEFETCPYVSPLSIPRLALLEKFGA